MTIRVATRSTLDGDGLGDPGGERLGSGIDADGSDGAAADGLAESPGEVPGSPVAVGER
jgi:hypothetical protein